MKPQKVTLTESEAAALYGEKTLEKLRRKWARKMGPAKAAAERIREGIPAALNEWERNKADAEQAAQWSRRAADLSADFQGKADELPPLFPAD